MFDDSADSDDSDYDIENTEDTDEDTSHRVQSVINLVPGRSPTSPGSNTVVDRIIKPLPTRRREIQPQTVFPSEPTASINPQTLPGYSTTAAPERKIKPLPIRRAMREKLAGPTVSAVAHVPPVIQAFESLNILASAAYSSAYLQPPTAATTSYSSLGGALDDSKITWIATPHNTAGQVSANAVGQHVDTVC